MINNRQAGRRRGRGGGNGNSGGSGQRQGGGSGMQGNGSRIDNRARGNATQLFEKYKNLASDAQRQGDRVNTEYYLQFADHYFRVLSEQRGRIDEQQQPRQPRNDFDYEGDDEFGDEGEPIRTGEQGDASRTDREPDREQRPREFRRDRDGNRDGNRDTGRDTGRDGNRDAPRETGRDNSESRQASEPRSDTRSDARSDGRQDGPRREWRDRDDRPPRRNGDYRDQRPADPEVVAGQRRAEPIAPGASLEQRAEEVLEVDRPLDPPARRRGRPRREDSEAVNDSEPTSSGLEADRLPPALTPTLAVAANDEGEPAPRRRRVRRPADETPTAAE